MEILKVSGLRKTYENFSLQDVSFSLEEGFIMGFIGRNGAGKTTTLKTMLGIARREAGEVELFGKNIDGAESRVKQRIGFMMGGADYYLKRRARTVAETAARFYEHWNPETWDQLVRRFDLNLDKKVGEFSQGMRIKFALAIALSHEAKLIILDEPTSGLDPVARDDLLQLFQELVEDGKKSILFSTHITSDLEKCADYITFIQDGRIIESCPKDELLDSYQLAFGSEEALKKAPGELISFRSHSFGSEGLIRRQVSPETGNSGGAGNPGGPGNSGSPGDSAGLETRRPSLDDIMVYHARREDNHA